MNELQKNFRESMSRLAAGVTLVTTEIDGRPWGLTVSASCSISMDPPLILISLANTNASTKAIMENNCFSVALLAQDQIEVALKGAKAGAPKFFEEFTERKGNAYYDIKQALANIHCKVDKVVEAGDHTIFIGLVEEVSLGDAQAPLLYFDRQFGEFQTAIKNN
ncbi:flavin reductase family protein [Bacillus tuaregi]|uniref:flavin reductase family protein n=1 Tax=Bacillus tuaregi TaxID=1816695 RepID=UPI0008F8FFC3|nr:flavin reductase family protein [Bacillus tuaregi]